MITLCVCVWLSACSTSSVVGALWEPDGLGVVVGASDASIHFMGFIVHCERVHVCVCLGVPLHGYP